MFLDPPPVTVHRAVPHPGIFAPALNQACLQATSKTFQDTVAQA